MQDNSCTDCEGELAENCWNATCSVDYSGFLNGTCCADLSETRIGAECVCSEGYVPSTGCALALPCAAGEMRDAETDDCRPHASSLQSISLLREGGQPV